MAREAVVLNGDKVRHCIAVSRIPRKQLLDGRVKTLQRILRGENTSLQAALQLAKELNVTLQELTVPVTDADLDQAMPEHWLYENGPIPEDISRHAQFLSLVGGGGHQYRVGGAPTWLVNPINELFKINTNFNRRIALRRDQHAFVLDLHYFDYSPDHERRVVYLFGTSCRFFPLARNGDVFSKSALSEMYRDYVWSWLCKAATSEAEIVAVEGDEFPEHPDAYLPLVRFFQGGLGRKFLGARLFSQLQADFRASMIDHLAAIPDRRRISASVEESGLTITIEPKQPAVLEPGWREKASIIAVDLVWRTASGALRRAPWRREHRNEFVNAIRDGRWSDCHSRGMPIRYFPPDWEDDPEPPPFAADPGVCPEDAAAIKALFG